MDNTDKPSHCTAGRLQAIRTIGTNKGTPKPKKSKAVGRYPNARLYARLTPAGIIKTAEQ
jgi:hypothetical protein